ncbi:MAG: PKD domain-containing protein [bacterium]
MRNTARLAIGASLAFLSLTVGGTRGHAADDARVADRVSAVLRSVSPSSLVRMRADGLRQVYVHALPGSRVERGALEALGAHVERTTDRLGVVQAWVPADRLDAIAALPGVRKVTPPTYGAARAGVAESEGGAILHSDELRALGLDGAGVRIGVISDGVDSLALSQASGDSPEVDIVDGRAGSGDEGTATLEVIHDLAPGATLGFCGGGQDNGITTVDFVTCAEKLVTEFGADAIVDDLGFPAEPYFEDGVVAQSVREVSGSGVLWVTAAGNDAQRHYQGQYVDSGNAFHAHDFGSGKVAVDVDVAAGGGTVFLEWANPYGAATDSYQVCFTDAGATALGICSNRILGEDVPLAVLELPCPGPNRCTATLLVSRTTGDARLLEMFFDRAKVPSFGTAADSIYGHPCVPGVISVVAIDAADSGHDTSEPFNSQGPCTIVFPEAEERGKPEIAAIDGVSISGAGGFPTPFHGTSAAAPHVVAIAAQLAQGFPSLSAPDVDRALSRSAVDLGDPGIDSVFGAGRVDALAAARFVDTPPESSIVAPASTTVILPGTSTSFAGSCSDVNGTGGMTTRWEFGAGSGVAPSTALNPGEVFFQVTGTFDVTFTCTDALGVADPTPAVRTVIVGVPPDGTIEEPSSDLGIVQGESVTFAASCSDPDETGSLTHRWTFGAGSGIPDSTVEDPGAITFANPGVFTVTYTCTDGSGAADPFPATRTITVDAAPDSVIDDPANDVTIARGASVHFAGHCSDTESGGPLSPTWTFGDGSGIADSTVAEPGDVVFGRAGTFTVTLTCKDRSGIPDPSPATRVVTVTGKNKSGGGGCAVASESGSSTAADLAAVAAGLALVLARRRARSGSVG